MTSEWRKSSRSSSGANGDNCVEARAHEGSFQVRDSKLGEGSPRLELQAGDFVSLLRAAR